MGDNNPSGAESADNETSEPCDTVRRKEFLKLLIRLSTDQALRDLFFGPNRSALLATKEFKDDFSHLTREDLAVLNTGIDESAVDETFFGSQSSGSDSRVRTGGGGELARSTLNTNARGEYSLKIELTIPKNG